MLTRVDHVMICVPDLERGIEAYRRLGFNIYPGGVHTGRATHNAIAFTGEEYLEVLSIRDRAAVTPGSPDESLARYLDRGGGFRVIALQSDDLEGDVAAMRRRGVDVGPIQDGGRRTPAGQELRWRAAFPGPGAPLPVFFIQHLTPFEERRRQVPKAGDHPNGALRVDRVYVTVPDVAAASRLYARVLGLPEPRIQRGAVIKADMAVFDLGPTGLTVAQPAEPGPAAEALGRCGPGPFQVLYRTSSMDGAVRWMTGHGLPEPAQGVRNTGERAILVTPEYTGGAYVGFVGPA
jgi:catechol 2,3-dioxygenase-like lactoylglutathione lyase family enzyme